MPSQKTADYTDGRRSSRMFNPAGPVRTRSPVPGSGMVAIHASCWPRGEVPKPTIVPPSAEPLSAVVGVQPPGVRRRKALLVRQRHQP